jgi:iron(III) transport system substrate-binding protein
MSLFLVACGGASAPAAQQPAPAAQPAQAVQATSNPAASAVSPALQAIIDGARTEGKLSLTYNENTGGGSKAVGLWTPEFNKAYGLNLDVQYTPGGNYVQETAKLIQELQAGRPSSMDVIVLATTNVPSLLDANALMDADWSAWAPNVQDPKLLESNGAVVRWYAQLPGMMYNTDKLKGDAVPKTLQDLLKPQYKGLIASTPYAAYFDSLASDAMWGADKTTSFATDYSKQLGGLIACGEGQRVASGEFTLFALDCGSYESQWLHAQGAPVAEVIPADAPILTWSYVAIPKNAPHPNAAKLWVNYLMSAGAQDILFQTKGPDNPYVPGSKTVDQMKAVENSGGKFTDVSVEFTQKYAQATTKPYQDIIKLFTTKNS